MIYPYNRRLFDNKMEGNSNTYGNTDKPWEHYAKWKKAVTKSHILCNYLYEMFWLGNSPEIESRLVVARDWKEEGMGNDW